MAMITPDDQRNALLERIYTLNAAEYEGVALEVWKYQYDGNPLYRSFCDLVRRGPKEVQRVRDIPFLPVIMFKTHDVMTGNWSPQAIFRSSGTTGEHRSRHLIRNIHWYHDIAARTFEVLLGPPEHYSWVALLPGYLGRPDSSLVDMVHSFMVRRGDTTDHFYPFPDEQLIHTLEVLRKEASPAMLIGVSYALLDLLSKPDVPLWSELTLIETGGMKGRGDELTRKELYDHYRKYYPDLNIISEYGMTELHSQAYTLEGIFRPGPLMQVLIRDISDPLSMVEPGSRGGINVIDLGNLDTCAFIATEDVGIGYPDGGFEVLGRLDDAEIRGCNLLYV